MAGRDHRGRFTAGGGGVRVRTQIKDVDHGYRAMMQRIESAKQASIAVGIMGEKGEEPVKDTHGNGQPRGGGRGLTVLAVASFHEFGQGVPERAFIRGWYDSFKDTARKQISLMLQSVIAGRRTKAQAMEVLGVRWVAELQKYIAVGTNLKPLERVTILAKGSSVPLVDTGQLKASITYRVEAAP